MRSKNVLFPSEAGMIDTLGANNEMKVRCDMVNRP